MCDNNQSYILRISNIALNYLMDNEEAVAKIEKMVEGLEDSGTDYLILHVLIKELFVKLVFAEEDRSDRNAEVQEDILVASIEMIDWIAIADTFLCKV